MNQLYPMGTSEADQKGYGETGVKTHPYHNQYGNDTYYPNVDHVNIQKLSNEARAGYESLHAYFAARAMQGDRTAMPCYDAISKTMLEAGFYFGGGKNSPWNESVFNRNRKITNR